MSLYSVHSGRTPDVASQIWPEWDPEGFRTVLGIVGKFGKRIFRTYISLVDTNALHTDSPSADSVRHARSLNQPPDSTEPAATALRDLTMPTATPVHPPPPAAASGAVLEPLNNGSSGSPNLPPLAPPAHLESSFFGPQTGESTAEPVSADVSSK